ncbi:MAG: hypothetical protein ABFD08_05920 [Syntrophomonas sp.]
MKTPDNFITSTQAATEWGFTRIWIYTQYKAGKFEDEEILETPWGVLFSREGITRVFGEPNPDRVAPNSGPRRNPPRRNNNRKANPKN